MHQFNRGRNRMKTFFDSQFINLLQELFDSDLSSSVVLLVWVWHKYDEIVRIVGQAVIKKIIEFEKKSIPSTSPLSKFIPIIGKMDKILLAQFS
ncbi:hypothetical protein Glove_421g79 [Diversispora epigaea]|uniref:Uncharacterized protein n=1 Tax=Diversispora epigaea TaxID=1348612 RepID=A0A397H3N2_9GLOM|nr:hypothetical protein Glove_421g79 [Diversispora epigaea]